MAVDNPQKKTLDPANQFCIKCPVFGVETDLSTCFRLRDKVWAGRRPDVRKGCQVAMDAGKCAATHIITEIFRKGTDNYYSPTRVVGHLSDSIIDAMGPVLIGTKVIDMSNCSAREKELLHQVNIDAADFVEGRVSGRKAPSRGKRKALGAEKPAALESIVAETPTPQSAPLPTQDMAALVTVMTQKEVAL